MAVISPRGEELARAPSSESENQQMEVPFDQPASVAFLGERLLVTNHSLFARNEDHYAVLDVFAGEQGLPLFRPHLARGRLKGFGQTEADGRRSKDVLSLEARLCAGEGPGPGHRSPVSR